MTSARAELMESLSAASVPTPLNSDSCLRSYCSTRYLTVRPDLLSSPSGTMCFSIFCISKTTRSCEVHFDHHDVDSNHCFSLLSIVSGSVVLLIIVLLKEIAFRRNRSCLFTLIVLCIVSTIARY